MENKHWDAITVTSKDQQHAQAFLRELQIKQKKGFIPNDTHILCVEDPRKNIGSGGATLNALLSTANYLSAISGNSVINADVLTNKSILILHAGLDYPYVSCCQGFVSLPCVQLRDATRSNAEWNLASCIDVILHQLGRVLAADSPPGLWIVNLDRVIVIPSCTRVDWQKSYPARLFLVPVDKETVFGKHGVCELNDDGTIDDILHLGSPQRSEIIKLPNEKYAAVSGIVYLNAYLAEQLLTLNFTIPSGLFTYSGLDVGATTIPKLSLFYDILLALAKKVQREDFVSGIRSGFQSNKAARYHDDVERIFIKEARAALWKELHGRDLKGELLKGGSFFYLSSSPQGMMSLLKSLPYSSFLDTKEFQFSRHSHVLSQNENDKMQTYTAVNSIISGVTVGKDSVVINSDLRGNSCIGSDCFISNISPYDLERLPDRFDFGDEVLLCSKTLKLFADSGKSEKLTRVIIILGTRDNVELSFLHPNATVFNKSWNIVMEKAGIQPSHLWDDRFTNDEKTLKNARLFPVFHLGDTFDLSDLFWLFKGAKDPVRSSKWHTSWRLSLEEISKLGHPQSEFNWRRELCYKITEAKFTRTLEDSTDTFLTPYLRTCVVEGFFRNILATLDSVAKNATSNSVRSRVFACIADVLACKAGNRELRSGPATHSSWKKALDLLKKEQYFEAVEALADERDSCLNRSELLIRASRHYEGACQIEITKAVMTARKFVNPIMCDPIRMGQEVTVEASARLDMSGSWNDTPPICYDQGGRVINIGLKVRGKKPITAKVRKIVSTKLVLFLGTMDDTIRVECEHMESLLDYAHPNATGALLKAAFFVCGILSLEDKRSLSEQLMVKYNCGFELYSVANLPHGSGLGTSSILAAAVLAALWRAIGFKPDHDSLVHAVLLLEQMMTTGGGWQDQVGGLYPSIKVGQSDRSLPLHVKTTPVMVPDGFYSELDGRLFLLFTGKTRLAKDTLQDVIRHWNARVPEIVETIHDLPNNVDKMIKALKEGNFAALGQCLNLNWEQKKRIAPGCEPSQCKLIMDAIAPHVHGQCLAGAGGGGFIYAIMKEPDSHQRLMEVIAHIKDLHIKPELYEVQVDHDGLQVKVEKIAED